MATKKQDKKQEKGRRAGWIAFGVTALLYAAIFPLYRIGDFILAAAVAFLVGKVVSIMGSGLDLTTHNREDQEREANQVAELPLSGDDAADAMISRGQDMLHQIRSENDAIPDEVLSGQMDELEHLCVQIFKTVAEKPAQGPADPQIHGLLPAHHPENAGQLPHHEQPWRVRQRHDRGALHGDPRHGHGADGVPEAAGYPVQGRYPGRVRRTSTCWSRC